MSNNKLILFFIIFTVLSCNKNSSKKGNKGVRYVIEIAKDTIKVGHSAKAIIHLAKPYVNSDKTKIVVFLERDGFQITKDNDSLDYIPKLGFHNMLYDVDNQKWSSDKLDYKRTSAIGKSFNVIGENYLKGYILEYYDGDPLLDSIYDYSNTRRHFFKHKIYVIE